MPENPYICAKTIQVYAIHWLHSCYLSSLTTKTRKLHKILHSIQIYLDITTDTDIRTVIQVIQNTHTQKKYKTTGQLLEQDIPRMYRSSI